MNGQNDKVKSEEISLYSKIYSEVESNYVAKSRKSYLFQSEAAFLARLQTSVKGKRVLEIGMGDGTHCILASQYGACEVVGIDISPQSIILANKRAKDVGVDNLVKFVNADIESLNLDLGLFDMIIDHEVFSSLTSKKSIPSLLNGLLKPGGVLLGLECLDNNLVFRINRRLGQFKGIRTRWSSMNILRHEDLNIFMSNFTLRYVSYHHLTSLLLYPLARIAHPAIMSPIIKKVNMLDSKLLSLPLIQPYAFKVVFEFEKR